MKKKAFTLAEILLTLGIVGVIAATTLPLLNNNTKNVQTTTKLAKAVSEFEQANLALLEDEGVDRLLDAFDGIGGPEYYNALSKHMKVSTASINGIFIQVANAATNFNMTKSEEFEKFNESKEKPVDPNEKPEGTKGANGGNAEVAPNGILKPVNTDFLQEALGYYDLPQHTHISTGSGIDYCILQQTFEGGWDQPLPPNQQRIGFLILDIDGPGNGSDKVGIDRFGFAIYNDGSLRAIGSQNWDNAGNQSTSWEDKCPNNAKIPDKELDALFCTGSIFENDMKIRYSAR